MGVFMDKIEFFLYIAEPSGVLGAAGGARWVRIGKAGAIGTPIGGLGGRERGEGWEGAA